MPNRRTKMKKIKETLRLHFDGSLSNQAVARSLKVSKGFVHNTLVRFKTAGLAWPLPAEMTESGLESALYPEKDDSADNVSAKTKPDYAYIAKELGKPHTTLQLLYDEFRDDFLDGIGRSVFYDEFRKYLSKHKLEMRTDYKGGDKLFVDYSGDGLRYIDRESGEVIPVELYVSCWGASSYTYCEATHTQKGEEWVNSHVQMQEYFGCVAGALVPDNLKSGVIKPSWYEPNLNPLYYEMAKHYDTVILPARVKHAKDKAVVESNVLHLQRFILGRLRNRVFFSLVEINDALRGLLEAYNDRPMKDYGGQSRRQRFLELDKPFAKPLPTERFSINKMKEGVRVGPDYHVRFADHFYSVPFKLVKERVTIYQTGNLIEIYHKGEHIVRHRKQAPNFRHTTLPEHMPSNHRFVKGINPSWLVFKGGEIGPLVAEVMKNILGKKKHPEQGYRACLGILRLARQYSDVRLEMACKRAVHFRSVYYKAIKTILEKGLDSQPFGDACISQEPSSQPIHHDNLRGSRYYEQA